MHDYRCALPVALLKRNSWAVRTRIGTVSDAGAGAVPAVVRASQFFRRGGAWRPNRRGIAL